MDIAQKIAEINVVFTVQKTAALLQKHPLTQKALMKLKLLLSFATALAAAPFANAAITTDTQFSVKYLSSLSGTYTGWQALGTSERNTTQAWVGSVPDTLSDYVVSSSQFTAAGFYNGTSNGYYKRTSVSTLTFPESSGSSTWFMGNANSGGGGKTTTAWNGGRYIEFSITAGLEDISITGVTWDFLGAKSNASSLLTFTTNAFYSLGTWDSTAQKIFGDEQGSTTSAQYVSTELINAGGACDILVEAGKTITFRIMADANSTAASTMIGLKNISLTGTVTPVPEPSTYALFGGLALAGIALVARRRKQK